MRPNEIYLKIFGTLLSCHLYEHFVELLILDIEEIEPNKFNQYQHAVYYAFGNVWRCQKHLLSLYFIKMPFIKVYFPLYRDETVYACIHGVIDTNIILSPEHFWAFVELLTCRTRIERALKPKLGYSCAQIYLCIVCAALFRHTDFFMQISRNPFNLPLCAMCIVNFRFCSIDQIRAFSYLCVEFIWCAIWKMRNLLLHSITSHNMDERKREM